MSNADLPAVPPAAGAVVHRPGTPPVTSTVPVPGAPPGTSKPGVQLSQRPRRRGDSFGWPSNAAPGKPEGEVDTRP
jgi:hypothetical protein